VYDLEGGLKDWVKEGKPVMKGNKIIVGEITPEEYEKMISSFPLVVIDFSATWCGPCKKLTPMLEKMGQKRSHDFKVEMIDVDENPAIAKKNEIEALPTLLWYKNGKLVKRVVGYHNEKEINQLIDELVK